ncbi:MAG: hypothetical protein ACLPL5_02710 [Stellaceae bacterium]
MKARILAAAAAWALLGAGPAWADFNVKTPDVNQGELAVETVGDAGFDPNHTKSGEQSYTAETEYGFTPWWQSELEFEFNRAPGSGMDTYFTQLTSENLFQFTERGEYWLDTGFFAEYGQAMQKGNPNETTFGPVLRKDFWGLSNSVNLFVEKDLGGSASGRPQFLWAWETRIEAWELKLGRHFAVEPGFQYYGQPGPLTRFARWNGQDNRAGPQLFGKLFNIGPGTLEWNGGVLFGLTSSVPRITPRWQLEYEIHY